MYRLRIESHFDAAHRLVGYGGKCSRLHGHTWRIEVFVVGKKPDKVGMLMDFQTLKKKVDQVAKRLDHNYLNDLREIGNPTSENISRYIYDSLKDLPKSVRLEKVRVWESSSCWCEYLQS